MERKIGEIFEYNCEWYQCVGGTCRNCSFYYDTVCKNITTIGSTNFGNCHCSLRTDHKSVIFKKLEKVGEPFTCNIHGDERLVWMQEYKLYDVNFCKENALLMYVSDYKHKRIAIEIKQNKEDMEEKKLNLKPFDIQKAREGKPVCTRGGRKVRIICFDYKGDTNAYPILALISTSNLSGVPSEIIAKYTEDGKYAKYNNVENDEDLMMLPEKKEGWIIVSKNATIYDSLEDAKKSFDLDKELCICKVEWKE